MKRTLCIFGLVFGSAMLYAQPAVLNNKGALIHANPGSIVKVKGTFVNDASSVFTNHGTTTIDSTFTNNALSEGNGVYRVGLHWENNYVFDADTSQVILIGNNQLITGDSVSWFYTLELQNAFVKQQTLNAFTTSFLKLNDSELATDSFDMTVTNPATGAITRTTGFVSSLGDGRLSRFTQSAGNYLFPTGSSLGTLRYRPVNIQPSDPSSNYYAVRMVNHIATIDGYDINDKDSVVCEVIPHFYHFINHNSGVSDADVSIHYYIPDDGEWDGLAYWNHTGDTQWEDLGPVGIGTTGIYNFRIGFDWNQWQYIPYALSKRRPEIPEITGDIEVCGGYTTLYNGLTNPPNSNLVWELTDGGTIVDSSGNPISIQWGMGNTNDTLQLIQLGANGCASFPAVLTINVNPQPIANFSATPTTALGSVPIIYTDSSQNAAIWYWDFGDGQTSNETDPQHIYNGEGTYITTLIVQTAEGCFDTAIVEINIIDGIHIPNVFTPNGDGNNDFFTINGTNFKNFEAVIFDRWGVIVFESNAPQLSWDGRTPTGAWASEGTYYLVLKITMLNGDVLDYSNFLSLFY